VTPDAFIEFASEFYGNCVAIMQAKNSDYSPDDVTLGEVLETACDLHITVQQALGVHLRKHWSALVTHLDGKRPLRSESVDNRLHDAANYLALVCLWERAHTTVIDAMRGVVSARPCECHLHPPEDPLRAMSGGPPGLVLVVCRRCLLIGYLDLLSTL